MTPDERINRLVERHEALAESVESLLATSQETDRRIRDTQQIIVTVARDLQGFASEIRTSVLALVGAIRNHEERIQGHEERIQNLEARQ